MHGDPRPEDRLRRALDASAGRARLWWRDDDAGRDDPRLARLLDLACRHGAPVALAVVPAWLEQACARRILDCPWATVLQHGIAHADHSLPSGKKIELGGRAPLAELAEGLEAMRRRLEQTFGSHLAPVLVPPWNRIAPDLVQWLPALGFRALSTYGPSTDKPGPPGLVRLNTHLDLIAWRAGRRPLTFEEAATRLTELLLRGDREPIGILSHHLVMNGDAFATLDRLLGLVQDHGLGHLHGDRALLEEG